MNGRSALLIGLLGFGTACGAARIDPSPDAGPTDAATVIEAGTADAGFIEADAEPIDTGAPIDTGTVDTGEPIDMGTADTGSPDADAPDADAPDADAADADAPDAGTPDTGAADAGTPDSGPQIPALYPSAPRWNDYVAADGPNRYAATGTACDPVLHGPGYDGCIHSGEKRVFVIAGPASCSGLVIRDALRLFDWICDDTTSPVRAISTGLKDEGPLSSLIDWSASPVAWRSNSVEVTDGMTPVFSSPMAAWWPNPVVTTTGGALDAAGAIYVVTASVGASFTIEADGVGLVTAPGALLTSPLTTAAVAAQGRDFLWVEGTIAGGSVGVQLGQVQMSVLRDVRVDGARTNGVSLAGGSNSNRLQRITANNVVTSAFSAGLTISASEANGVYGLLATGNRSGLILDGARFNSLHTITVRDSRSHGLWLRGGASDNQLTDVRATGQGTGGHGVFVDGTSHRSWWRNVVSADNGGDGVLVTTCDNTLIDVVTSNNRRYGVEVALGATNNRFVGLVAASNAFRGVLVDGADHNLFAGITVMNTASNGGLELDNASNNTVSGAAVVNAAGVNSGGVLVRGGATMPTTSGNQFADLASAHNGSFGVHLDEAHDGRFTGLLILGGHESLDCEIAGGVNPGLRLEGILQGDEECVIDGVSDATVELAADLTVAFVGKVQADDGVSPDDTDGLARYGDITDWTALLHPLRIWGADSSAVFPDAAHRGPCAVNTDCRIWDAALRMTDTTLRERAALPDGDATLEHRWQAADMTACAAISGATWNGATCTTSFLRRAAERIHDGVGNDDGLCESQESCVFWPNIGAYQGHGDLTSAGAFVDGAISGVTLVRFEDNGR